MSSVRVRRAAAEDLYKSCKLGGDCIPDVVNKFENKTIADHILQWGSAAVYFGGLGIGTGGAKPTRPGAGVGWNIPREVPYRPLGAGGTQNTGGGWQIPREGIYRLPRPRPGVPAVSRGIETVLPGTVSEGSLSSSDIAIGEVGPSAPSVIIPEAVPANPATSGIDIVTESPDTVSVSIDLGTSEREVAVLEVPPNEGTENLTSVTTRNGSSRSTYQLEPRVFLVGETSETAQVLVAGDNIGGTSGESIELTQFTGPRTSTPLSTENSAARGVRNFFSRRYYTQVQVEDTAFLTQPRRWVTESSYDNPAFEQGDDVDESIALPDVQTRPYPKNSDLLDLGRLSRVHYTKDTQGLIGVSRIGTRFSLNTRRGTNIGAQVHFRLPVSGIAEELELSDLTDLNNVAVIEDDTPATVSLGPNSTGQLQEVDLNESSETLSESDLLDTPESVQFGPLSFGYSDENGIETVPLPQPEIESSFNVESTLNIPSSNGRSPGDSAGPFPTRKRPWTDLEPAIYVYEDAAYMLKFYWLSDHLIKKKKRKQWYL